MVGRGGGGGVGVISGTWLAGGGGGVAGPGGGCYHDILGYKSGQGVTLGHTLGKGHKACH